jgi:uncharacterized protein YjaG (DUF416 family)
MLRYDEPVLVRDLARVRSDSRVAFAAACAERLRPAYSDFCKIAGRGHQAALDGILERVWRHLNAADYYVLHRLGIEEESQLMAHPTVQAECSRQRRDLRELLEGQPASTELFVRLRDRAREEARIFFVSDS